MSDYLVKSIDRTPNIDIRFETDIAGGGGEGRLEWLDLKDRRTGAVERVAAQHCSSSSAPTRAPTGFHPQSSVTPGATSRRVDTASAMSTLAGERAPLMFETTHAGCLRGR